MIEIDASQGEGGGQILRTSLALAMCTGQTVELKNIRARRPKPGLMRQHLACVLAAAEVCGGAASGAELGSPQLRFEPGPVRAGAYSFAVGSAGSCMLVLQTVLPALLLADAPSVVALSGGTHNPMAPPFHFIERSFVPLLRRMGADVQLALRRHGFYPAGGGEAVVEVYPPANGLQPFDLMLRGEPQSAKAESLVAGIPRGVAQRELEALALALGWSAEQLHIMPLRQNEGPGNALMATLQHAAVTEVFTQFGERSLPAEEVARRLAAEVRQYANSDAAVGPHLVDQLALPLALAVRASGRPASYTASEITLHAHTNFRVIERFLPVVFEVCAERGASCWRIDVRPAA
jgi:RNA 3'-terminal phosphate cyclase (ATP)